MRFQLKTNKPSATKSIVPELGSINPEDIFGNLHDLLNEIAYSCRQSIDEPHPNLVHLEQACKNLGALAKCAPLLMKGDKMGAILSDPEVLLHLPNIDVRQITFHANTLMEAAKLYLGTSDESLSNSDVARQFLTLMHQIVSPSDDRGVIERTGKAFARTVNDSLHKYFDNLAKMEKEKEITKGSSPDGDNQSEIKFNA